MSADLLSPPPHLPPAAALRLSQEAPRVLGNSSSKSLPYPFSLLYAAESPETWIRYENLLLACLRTGDDRSARLCLERLAERFGDPNQRVKALRGLYQEAVAPDNNALEAILKSYEKEIKDDPANMPIRKRRIALLKSMSKVPDAIAALVELLDVSPTDVEAWSELADLYLTQKLYPQAVFSMEEVLLITPNAWNAHARMGELLYISAISTTNNDGGTTRILSESIKRFCRSIELCENYLRGYYGLNLVESSYWQ
ncbi:hypothetical protein BDY21DRAFT_345670 [Lineolata rhizophorae]|uniref:ER membrane protein complex subunit 2 n=1 Tax=Lineolata rhizophorae TaxID=578093 RepID=A0A6A6NZG7_9PEZI|nr:hypothetical protein BDY21DRAFT_345670 [Lineolata rhizophorae]